MELMSSILLYTLLAVLPQALGDLDSKKDILLSSGSSNDISNNVKRMLMLNSGVPQVYKVTPIQSVFMDMSCRKCGICMDWALRAMGQQRDHIMVRKPSHEEIHYELMPELQVPLHRYIVKRNVKDSEIESEMRQKPRVKRHKRTKTVTVTKFNKDGAIYALKVKETGPYVSEQPHTARESSCQVYKVQQSYSCKSDEGETLLAIARGKKEYKKENDRTEIKGTQQGNSNGVHENNVQNEVPPDNIQKYDSKEASQTKERSSRAADHFPRNEESPVGQNPESFMPSIELY